MKNKNTIKIYGGRFFPETFVYVNCGFLLIGLYALTDNIPVGLTLSFINCFFIFTPTGIEINYSEKLYRNYINILGYNVGKWTSYTEFPYLTMITKKVEPPDIRLPFIAPPPDKCYEIYLLNQTHQKKVEVKKLTNFDEAQKELKELAAKLNLSITDYNPPVSVKTAVKTKVKRNK